MIIKVTMNKIYFLSLLFVAMHFNAMAQSTIEIGPSQSMSITGKGAGQDAAINPYSKENSIGIIENVGKNSFVIRIQKMGTVIKMITIKPKETKEVNLLIGYELYLDSELTSKAKVSFKQRS
jgi:hypothetical protein